MSNINLTQGMTQNNIPFVRLEGGAKTAMVWFGGPGNALPSRRLFDFTKPFLPLLDAYSIVFLTRRNGLSEGYSTQNMSDDYAELITTEYEGHVDLIIGVSYGGIVAQHFAADHPELSDHVVISIAAYKVSDEGKALDYRFAELLNQNKPRQAWVGMAPALTSSKITRALLQPALWLLAPIIMGDTYNDGFRRDVLIEAEAEVAHDSRESLTRITKPTLIQAGEHDPYFPLELFREMEDLIPDGNAKLLIYSGKGHNIFDDEQPVRDILEWVAALESP